MKILIPLSLLIVGLAIGYAVGINSYEIENESLNITDSIPLVPTIVHDTIVKTKIIEIEPKPIVVVNVDSLKLDSLQLKVIELDTLLGKVIEPIDSVVDDESNILSDVRLKLDKFQINHLTTKKDGSDSLFKLAIEINDVEKKYINVEFWESPINFSGYKLSKSKLIIYGLSPQFDYQLFKKEKIYYLKFHSITYELIETEDFKKFIQTTQLIK